MTDRELRRLGRAELVDIIYELQSRNQQCEAEIEKLQKALDDKILKIASAGSIAEAALKLSGIFEAVQAAADQYLASLEARMGRDEEKRA